MTSRIGTIAAIIEPASSSFQTVPYWPIASEISTCTTRISCRGAISRGQKNEFHSLYFSFDFGGNLQFDMGYEVSKSESRDLPIGAGFAAAMHDAGFRVVADNLPPPEISAPQPGFRLDAMTALRQISHRFERRAIFDQQAAAGIAAVYIPTRPIQRFLRIELVIDHGADDLEVTLRLHETTHDAEARPKLAVL